MRGDAPGTRLLVCALLAVACRGRSGAFQQPPEDEAWISRDALERGEVRVEEVKDREIPRSVLAAGRVAFDDLRVTHVFSPVTGRITRVLAQPGQRVRKGSPLAAILSPDVGSAFADVVKARADLVASERELHRQKELAAEQAGSQRELETAQDNWQKARAEYTRARQKAALLRSGSLDSVIQEYVLRSPIEGEVIGRSANPGVEVQGQYSGGNAAELFIVGDISRVWVVADVAQAELPRVRLGDDVRVYVVAYPERVFTGKVDYIASSLDPVLRTAKVRCVLENPDGALKPEMYATVSIATEPKRALSVSRHALTKISEQTFVFVQAGGAGDGRQVFKRRLVHVAEEDEGDYVPVLEGLTTGERVVVEGAVGRETADDEARLTPRQIESARIQLAQATEQDVEDAVTVGGRLAFDDLRITHVFSPVSGRVTRVFAQPGQRVRKGAPLAAVLSPDLGSALSDLVKAQADLTVAEHEYQRQKELYEAHAGAKRDLETAEGAWRKGQAELERAQQKGRLLNAGDIDRASQEYVLRSPIDGTVIARSVGLGLEIQGQYSGASNAPELFTIGEMDRLWVMGDVFEMDLPHVRHGLPVSVRVPAYPDRLFRGTIDWVSDVLDPATRTAKFRCVLDNADGILKPDMYEAVTIAIPAQQQLVVPRRALLRVGRQTVVFVAGGESPDGKRIFKMRRVIANEEKAGGSVSIINGLKPGERIVVEGAIFVLGLLST